MRILIPVSISFLFYHVKQAKKKSEIKNIKKKIILSWWREQNTNKDENKREDVKVKMMKC